MNRALERGEKGVTAESTPGSSKGEEEDHGDESWIDELEDKGWWMVRVLLRADADQPQVPPRAHQVHVAGRVPQTRQILAKAYHHSATR